MRIIIIGTYIFSFWTAYVHSIYHIIIENQQSLKGGPQNRFLSEIQGCRDSYVQCWKKKNPNKQRKKKNSVILLDHQHLFFSKQLFFSLRQTKLSKTQIQHQNNYNQIREIKFKTELLHYFSQVCKKFKNTYVYLFLF